MKTFIYILLGLMPCLAVSSRSDAADCLECHMDLTSKKVVHTAVKMGCASCHIGVDAATIPHKFKKGRRGLIAEPPELCYGCHDRKEFTRKSQHAPAASGACNSCHDYHTSDNENLLLADTYKLCIQCHPEIPEKPHVIIQMMGSSHVLLGRKDPNRKGKPFDCTSCHLPHSSDWGKLYRYQATQSSELCKNCHDFLE